MIYYLMIWYLIGFVVYYIGMEKDEEVLFGELGALFILTSLWPMVVIMIVHDFCVVRDLDKYKIFKK